MHCLPLLKIVSNSLLLLYESELKHPLESFHTVSERNAASNQCEEFHERIWNQFFVGMMMIFLCFIPLMQIYFSIIYAYVVPFRYYNTHKTDTAMQ